jgi:hypothetical protein
LDFNALLRSCQREAVDIQIELRALDTRGEINCHDLENVGRGQDSDEGPEKADPLNSLSYAAE